MLGDVIVKYARQDMAKGLIVEIAVGAVRLSAISHIEHLGFDLMFYHYSGMDNGHYSPASQITLIRTRQEDR